MRRYGSVDIFLEARGTRQQGDVLVIDYGDRLFVREPLRFTSKEEIRQFMRQSGLEEAGSSIMDVKAQGRVYEGVFCAR